LIRHLAP